MSNEGTNQTASTSEGTYLQRTHDSDVLFRHSGHAALVGGNEDEHVVRLKTREARDRCLQVLEVPAQVNELSGHVREICERKQHGRGREAK